MAVKPVVWTRDLVTRFWDGLAQTRLLDKMSFAALAGEQCLQVFSPFLDKDKSYIDFGGGDGHFAKLLCAQGYRVAIYDISEGRARRASEALSEFDTFLGHVGPGTDQKFAGVFFLEVAEHILEEDIASTYQQICDCLEPGGLLFLTTPNQEDLESGFTVEPQSGALFHRWQHVRTFNRNSLAEMLKPFTLNQVLIHEIDFRTEVFAALNEATAGVGNIFGAMRPVYFNSRPNLVGVFSKGAPPFKVDEFPCNVSVMAIADISPDALLGVPNGWQEITLPTASIAPESGSCFACGLESIEPWDEADHPAASVIRLYEDGVQLGPAHASHDEIQQSGAGRYSHWKGRLYFSSSDGSDPRINGRRYEVRAPVWTLHLHDTRLRGVLTQIFERDERLRKSQSLIAYLNERLGEAQSQIAEANERSHRAHSQVAKSEKALNEAQLHASRLEETIARLRARSLRGVLRRLGGKRPDEAIRGRGP